MKIHELSKQSGIHLETIRYYEKMGLMPEPKRLANGYRCLLYTSMDTFPYVEELSCTLNVQFLPVLLNIYLWSSSLWALLAH